MRMNDKLKGVLFVAFGASIYGMLATVVKIAYKNGYTTAEVTSSQFLIGILGLLILNFVQTQRSTDKLPLPTQPDFFKLLLAGTSLGFTSLFYYLSVQFINVSIAIVLLMQSVWIGIVVESIMSKTFPSWRKIISTIIILAGTLLATNAINMEVSLDWRGIMWGMLAACSFSLTMFTSNRVANYLPALRKSLFMLCGGAIIVGLFLLFAQILPFQMESLAEFYTQNGIHLGEARAYDFSILWKFGIFLAVFGTILPPILFNLGFPKVGLGLGSILSSMELPVSVLFAFILLGEKVILVQWIGIAMILSAIVLMNLNAKGSSISH